MNKDVFPAFPVPREMAWAQNAEGKNTPLAGMTLREYLAAHAMQGMLANSECDLGPLTEIPQAAVKMADAMLGALRK